MRALMLLLSLGLAGTAAAQTLPTEPVSFGGGRVVFGGEFTATVAPDDSGYFNYSNYEYSTLRNVRFGLVTEVRAHERLQFVAEVRADRGGLLQPYALYARVRPWPARRFDVQIGRIPPTFGAFPRQVYANDNFLIGIPLAYQYLTSLRSDAVPSSADELLAERGRGWLTAYSVGDVTEKAGLPIVNTIRWDTGIQGHGVVGTVEWTGAVTTGSLSNPRFTDDNRSRQLAGRVVWRPHPGLALGTSFANGGFLSRTIWPQVNRASIDRGTQRGIGGDAEYSAGRALVRGELIWSRWRLPMVTAPLIDHDLTARSLMVEGRYRLWPGVYAAARGERLDFNDIAGSGGPQTWDAPVRRLELGSGYSITRNVVIKAVWQRNTRDGGRVRTQGLGAVQLLYWF